MANAACSSKEVPRQPPGSSENGSPPPEALPSHPRPFSALFHQASTLISVLDTAGMVMDVNNAARAVAHLRRDHQANQPFWEMFWWKHPADVRNTVQAAVEAAVAGEPGRFQSAYFSAVGDERWVDLCITPIRDGGRVVAVLVEGRDITDLKAAHRAIEVARDTAERANQAKDDFLATLSHELRTPLGPVLLLASESSQNEALPPSAREDFGTITRLVTLEARLIDDLLDLTRISRGKIALNLQMVELHAALHDALGTVRAEVSQKQLSVPLELNAGNPVVMADPVRLQQILWNVLKNAVKFTPAGGRILVQTSLNPTAGNVVMNVVDNGIGITADELPCLFEPFRQGEHASGGGSRAFGGLGLGLAISRAIAELHSGRIWATSAGRGKGAVFTLELPFLHQAVCPAAEEETEPGASDSPGPDDLPTPPMQCRILVVEAHDASRTTLMGLLQRRHFDVAAAASMRQALKLAADRGVDLLLSELTLPDGDGYQLLAVLRSWHPAVVGVAMSGDGAPDDILRSSQAGFNTHLVKPLCLEMLKTAFVNAFAILPTEGRAAGSQGGGYLAQAPQS